MKGRTPAPTFQILGAEVTERTDEGIVIMFLVEGTNTGDESLPVREVEYSLELDGRRVFSGTRNGEVTLPRRGVQVLQLPAPIAHGGDALADARDDDVAGHRVEQRADRRLLEDGVDAWDAPRVHGRRPPGDGCVADIVARARAGIKKGTAMQFGLDLPPGRGVESEEEIAKGGCARIPRA